MAVGWPVSCSGRSVPEQKVTCNKQEETLWVKGVKFGELIAANLNSQAVYILCPGKFCFSRYMLLSFLPGLTQFWHSSEDVIMSIINKNLARDKPLDTND